MVRAAASGRGLAILITTVAIASNVFSAEPPAPSARGDGPAPMARPAGFTRHDPAFDALIARNARVELVARGFGLNEGTTWVRERRGGGFLLVGGLLDNVLYKVTADGQVSVFLDNAGYSGTDLENTGAQTRAGRSHVLLIGPSCSGVDPQGRVLWCADNDRRLMRLESDGTRTVLSAGADGQRFNGPNDIAIRPDDGAVFLTDNDFGLRGAGRSPLKELQSGVWLIKDGVTRRLLTDTQLGGIPNGVALSIDGKFLFLTAGNRLMRYPVLPDDTLGDGLLFAQGTGIGDGLRADTHGNLYSTGGAGPGLVRVTAPDGRLLGTIDLPVIGGEPKTQICATNVAFGDADGRTLYVAACDAVYRVRLKVAGPLQGPER